MTSQQYDRDFDDDEARAMEERRRMQRRRRVTHRQLHLLLKLRNEARNALAVHDAAQRNGGRP